MSTPHPVIGVLRAGMLLGLGWVVAAVVAWQALGVVWAVLLLFVWLILQRFFHREVQRLGESVAASARREATRPPNEETPC